MKNYVGPVGLALLMAVMVSATGRASAFWAKVHERFQRTASRAFCARYVRARNAVPLISFTFDDFPESALHRGGATLKSFGLAGTYYASLAFMGRQMRCGSNEHMPMGKMFSEEDLQDLLAEGHELGCHTFGHCHSWQTSPEVFERSVRENMRALERLFAGASFKTFSYPVSGPRPQSKRRIAKYFMCCRGSGQGFNAGRADLNYLNAYFIREGRSDLDTIKALIHQNCNERGWLIFATHDISGTPTPFGCNPRLFREVVRFAMNSGARVLPVAKACELFVHGREKRILHRQAELSAC